MNTEILKRETRECLEKNILPFWLEKMQDPCGGWRGEVDGSGRIVEGAPKGAVLNARILWAFSAAYRVLRKAEYLEAATRAKREIIERFYDKQYGGIFWSLDSQGRPLETKKQSYAIGFAIYGLSEYSRATGDSQAKEYAIKLFKDLEEHARDFDKGGYWEALSRDWKPLEDMRLSSKDENMSKTMNTHLHIIEPYTNLYRIWPDAKLREAIESLMDVFSEKIIDPESGHMRLFFDNDWKPTSAEVSYGHDIEASWLLDESSQVVGDQRLKPIVKRLAEVSKGGLKPTDQWWVFAETVVGYCNIAQRFGPSPESLKIAFDTWKFIKEHLVDLQGGEWWWSLKEDGSPMTDEDKAGFWKCPYHNSRMCLELMESF